MLQWTWGCRYLFERMISFPLNKYPEVLDHMVVPLLIFWGTSIPFSIMAAPIYIPTNSARGFPFLHILINTFSYLFDVSYSTRCEWIAGLMFLRSLARVFTLLVRQIASSWGAGTRVSSLPPWPGPHLSFQPHSDLLRTQSLFTMCWTTLVIMCEGGDVVEDVPFTWPTARDLAACST